MTSGHTITITPANLHVEVVVNGEKVAESDRPVLLDETGLPTRYYLPREDVRTELLRPSESSTHCPFKGHASYWSVEAGGNTFADLVWTYEAPIPEAEGITGLLCFYNERVDLVIDGQAQTRPETPFSGSADCAGS
jgi:uncharacterized protein (DUF427 family)